MIAPTRLYVLMEIAYVNRENDKDYSRHWQAIHPGTGKTIELSNDKCDRVEIEMLSIWNMVTFPPKEQTHWNSKKRAEQWLMTYAERVL